MNRVQGLEWEITSAVHRVFYDVYNDLGFGFLESVYRNAMMIALARAGIEAAAEVAIPVSYEGQLVGLFRADIVVAGKVILELKTASEISRGHEAQLLNYLRATRIEVGLILNFGEQPKSRRMEFPNDKKLGLASSALIVF